MSSDSFFSPGIVISGISYPNSIVDVLRDFVLVDQVKTDSLGKFSISHRDITPGTYTYVLKTTDPRGFISPPITTTVVLSEDSVTDVAGLLFAPTISVNKTRVARGSNILVYGYAPLNYRLEIITESDSDSFEGATEVNGLGEYSFSFGTFDFSKTSYRVFSRLLEIPSLRSFIDTFRVGDVDELKDEVDQVCPKKADLNNDCKVNLVDFSIAAFWWGKELSSSFAEKERSVLSGDNKIDLSDFSIMAFYWTG